jgi:hypothetical protein
MAAPRPPLGDPAAEAARLLCRLALIILMIITPVAELFSHGALYVLLPVGATILVIAGWLSSGLRGLHLGAALLTSIGLAALFLVFWSGLSLAWTPFPTEGAARFGSALGTGLVVLLAIAFLPERTRAPNLYLLPIGVAVTAIATCFVILFGPQSFWQGPNPDHTLAQRCLVSISILLWPALGALALRERWLLAVCLALAVTAAAFAAFLQIALAAIALGAVVYTIAVANAPRTAGVAAFCFAALVLLAPILVVFAVLLSDWTQLPNSAAAIADMVVTQWPRLITGHGLGTAAQGIEFGALPPDTPRSILFTIWYELGFLGAVAFAVLGVRVFVAAGRAPLHVAPPLLAGLAAGLTIALWGTETTQLWWITLNGLDAIAFALLFKAHPRFKRPPAPAFAEEPEFES